MPGNSKKRKASELEHETDHANTKSTKKQTNKKRSSIASIDEIPFTTYCPVTNATKYKTKDVFVENREIVPGYTFDYAVEPGSRWTTMKTYRNVKYSEHTFTIGGIVYINNKSPPPKPPPPTASDAELLTYDRENFWVARIADTRAESDRAVYLRVFWLYWPEELPMGRQPYHADQELVMSNAMDILDAQTIASAADVTHWDENDMGSRLGERFWRQTFDIGKLGKDRKGGLSVLKKHCICHQPYNPNTMMYQCKNTGCHTWNHEACLLEDLRQRSWDAYERGALDDLDIQHMKNESNGDKHGLLTTLGRYVHDKVKPAVEAVADQAVVHATDVLSDVRPTDNDGSPKKKGRPRNSEPTNKTKSITSVLSTPWEGKLRVAIVDTGDRVDEPVLATIEEVTGTKNPKKGRKSKLSGKTWTIPVQCLVCRTFMD